MIKRSNISHMKDLEKVLEKYFLTKAPALPADIVKLVVTYGPYVLAIMLVLSALSILSMLGLNALVINPLNMFMGPAFGTWYQVYMVFMIVSAALAALALPGLLKRQMAGWKYLYYAALVTLVQNIVMMDIGGVIIGSGLTMYMLFQIRSSYS